MRDPSFPNGFNPNNPNGPTQIPGKSPSTGSLQERLIKIFNTALISSHSSDLTDTTQELEAIFRTPAFKSILKSVGQLALDEGISEQEAASQIIQAFRRVDEIWKNYLFLEGIDRLKNPPQNPNGPGN